MNSIICECINLKKEDLQKELFNYHHNLKKTEIDYIKYQFPIPPDCKKCENTILESISQYKATNTRTYFWKETSNYNWIKKAYKLFKDQNIDIEIIDFYNGKLFVKTNEETLNKAYKLHKEISYINLTHD